MNKKSKSLYGVGGRCLKIRRLYGLFFEPYFKVHNLVSVYPKSIILRQMTNLNMIFHAVVSVYRLLKIWNSPQFPAEFRNGKLALTTFCSMSSLARARCSLLPLAKNPLWSSFELSLAPDSSSISFIEVPFFPITKPIKSPGTAINSDASSLLFLCQLSLIDLSRIAHCSEQIK